MSYKIVMVSSFYKDANEIFFYISQRLGAQQAAEGLLEQVYQKAKKLADSPALGRVFILTDGTKTEFRRINVRNYSMFYYVNEEKHTIEIRRLIYSRRNLELILK